MPGRAILIALLALVSLTFFTGLGSANGIPNPTGTLTPGVIGVKIDDRLINLSLEPYVENGRVVAPAREILDGLGVEVRWAADTETLIAVKGDMVVKIKVGESQVLVNGEVSESGVPARLFNDRLVLPVRYLAEIFGAVVSWDDPDKLVLIKTDKTMTVTEKVASLFLRLQKNPGDLFLKNEIVRLLPGIDWAELDRTGDVKVIDLMAWVSGQDDEDCLIALFRARKNLDGFMVESYSNAVGEAFRKDKRSFIRLLSKLPEKDIDEVAGFVAYHSSYSNTKDIRKQIFSLLVLPDLSDKEKYTANRILEELARQSTG